MLDLAIVGGGPGGLMSAWYLKKKLGALCRVTIYEASDRVGGKILTKKFDTAPAMYEADLQLWLERGLPLICANPDKFVEVGKKLVYCAGAMADIYAARGGEVLMAGKPYRPIYDEALKLAEAAAGRRIDPGRVLAIGDSVRTGSATFGADLLFITGSIHAEELDAFGTPDPAKVEALVAPSGARLSGFMPRLAW